MTDRPNTFVGLDLSGPVTRCLVATAEGSRLEYLGCGSMPPVRWDAHDSWDEQMSKQSVQEAIFEAERSVGQAIVSAVVGLGGHRVASHYVQQDTVLASRKSLVTMSDVRDAVQQCAAKVSGNDSMVLQLVPLEFGADSLRGLTNPVGLRAQRLRALVRVITTDRSAHERARDLVNRVQINVQETVLGGFAAAYSSLDREEVEHGVAHLDLGKESSTLTAYCGGVFRHASAIPLGRDQIVSDVGQVFNTDSAVASALITDFGRVHLGGKGSPCYVLVPETAGDGSRLLNRPRPRRTLDKIITFRLQACFELVRDDLSHEGLMNGAIRSLVLTGDLAELPGIAQLADRVVGLRTRIGVPAAPEALPIDLRSPKWACAAGLASYALRLAGGLEGSPGAVPERATAASQFFGVRG